MGAERSPTAARTITRSASIFVAGTSCGAGTDLARTTVIVTRHDRLILQVVLVPYASYHARLRHLGVIAATFAGSMSIFTTGTWRRQARGLAVA